MDEPPEDCSTCGGSGIIDTHVGYLPTGYARFVEEDCPDCGWQATRCDWYAMSEGWTTSCGVVITESEPPRLCPECGKSVEPDVMP